jgi:2-polyprenyl-3-methyl-5-hydroxy-6-metoxy-1,4-benzoquinol methylase
MSTQLPSPNEIAGHYNRLLQELKGDYIHQRWGDSEIKRRHYRQTETAIRHALGEVASMGEVLEIGCGPAVWSPLFLAQSTGARLLDISEEMLAQARINLERWEDGRHARKVGYTCGDFLEVDMDGAAYDTIVSARAFEYMSDKDAFVRKCFGLLRPGGTLVLVTKNKTWRDLVRTARDLAGVPREEIPVGIAMHLDLVAWDRAVEMFRSAGFGEVQARPVVIGSYHRPFTSRPGLAYADLLHRRVYRKPMSRLSRHVESLAESYVVIGRRDA